ncbi:MAG: hypothetical protein BYD32DRAFT_49935 [Podila humilis]|nr:MAG: hypothetical protein BYD32DRAFT_49935 [Podila humilis]
MMASMDFLAPLADLQLNSNNNNSTTSTKPIRTFSRLAKGTPLNNNSLFLTTQPTISSSPLSAPPPTTTTATTTQYTPSKVMRFHRSTPSTPVDNSGDDFLRPGCDQRTQPDKEKQLSKMFTAHRHLDRQDIDLLSPLQPHLDKLAPVPAPSLSLSTMPLTPLTPSPSTPFKPTFTRITKPAFHVNTLDNNSMSMNSCTDKKETETCTSTSAKSCRGYGGFHRASNPGTPSSTPSLDLGRNNTLAPSLLLLPGHGNDVEHGQGHGRRHGHEHGRSSSTSSSSSLSSPTLTPPELSPSTTSWSESSSSPQFLLPALDYDWWRKDGSSSATTPTLSSFSSKSTPLSGGPNSSVLPSPHFYSLSSARKGAMEGHELGSEQDTYSTPGPWPLRQTFRRTTEATTPQSDYIGLLLSGSDEEDEASEHSTDPDDGILSSSSCSSSPPRHGYLIKPKTAFHRPRFPAPPPALTGFSAITSKSISSATSTSEPSPQDFLGEADLPYPLPSTLQERQARQRKRAEQLKQLQIREEREARLSENRRRMRRRGASFSAGMSLTTPPAAAPTASRPASMSFVTPLCINRSSPSLLKRSPSSPAKKSGLGSGRPKNCVGFDLRRTKVFEYDASEEVDKSSSPLSSGDEGVEEEEVEDDDDDEEEEDDEEGHEGDYFGFTPSLILSPDRKNISNIAEEDESLIS